MEAQVLKENQPRYKYGYKTKYKSFNHILLDTFLTDDPDESLDNVITSLCINGVHIIHDSHTMMHLEMFVAKPVEYILLD